MTVLRVILYLLLLAALYGAGHFGYKNYLYNQRLETWKFAVLADIPVDVSKQRIINGTVQLTTLRPCKVQFLLVRTDGLPFELKHLGEIFSFGTLSVDIDKDMTLRPLRGEMATPHQDMPHAAIIASMLPWNELPTSFRFHCQLSETLLQKVPMRLQIKYELCGIEQFPALFCFALASLCAGIAILLATILYRTRRKQSAS